MRLGVFGGTFNPIHNGHIHLAVMLSKGFSLDKTLLIPANTPPHKTAPGLVSGAHRLQMCRLASADYPNLEVSDMELLREGESYTVYTVRALRAQYPGAELYLIMGCDMLACFTKWYRFEEIMQGATLLAGARNPGEYEHMLGYARELERFGGHCFVEPIEPLPVSSTEIRLKTAKGGEINELVHPDVACYIALHHLYQSN